MRLASNRFKGREVRGTFRYKKWPLEERRNTAKPFKHRTPRWWSHEEEEKRGGLAPSAFVSAKFRFPLDLIPDSFDTRLLFSV